MMVVTDRGLIRRGGRGREEVAKEEYSGEFVEEEGNRGGGRGEGMTVD